MSYFLYFVTQLCSAGHVSSLLPDKVSISRSCLQCVCWERLMSTNDLLGIRRQQHQSVHQRLTPQWSERSIREQNNNLQPLVRGKESRLGVFTLCVCACICACSVYILMFLHEEYIFQCVYLMVGGTDRELQLLPGHLRGIGRPQ